MKHSVRKIRRGAVPHTQRKRKVVGGYNDQNKGATKSPIGTPDHAKVYFKNSGFPREYFDADDASYIDIAANVSPTIVTAHDKLYAKIKLLNYVHRIENKLEVNEDLSAFRRKAIDDYREAIQTQLEPPLLNKTVIKQFNAGKLHNFDPRQADKHADASCKTHSYLELLFGYEISREDRKGDRNALEYAYAPGDAKSADYIKAVERLTTCTASDFNTKVTAKNYHVFKIRWAKVGEALPRIGPHRDFPDVEDPLVSVHPVVAFWLSRHKQVKDYFDTTFKTVKDTVLPTTVREEIAVCRADQRQLLMLLCGDVPAEMFVDPKTGIIRDERQISHHILYLTKPHHMSNTYLGVLMQNVNRFVNTVRHGGKSLAKMLGWSLVAMVQMIGLFSAVAVLYRDNVTHVMAQNVFYVLAYLLKTFVLLVLRVTGLSRREIRAYTVVTDVDETMRLLQTLGASYFVWRLLWTIEKDVNHNLRLPAMKIPFQRAMDNFNLTRAMLWLSQLKPGVFGESTVSGVTDEQLGKMQQAQNEMKQLDIEVSKARRADIESYMARFEQSHKSRSRKMLWADLNTDYHSARASFVHPCKMRQKYLKKYPHEFRAHHFFDSYGNARNPLQIVLAYFCYWRREERELTIPVVPYNDSTVHEYLHPDELSPAKKLQRSRTLKGSLVHLNPIQRSEFYRKSPLFSPPHLRESVSPQDARRLHEENIKEHTDREIGAVYHAHIDIHDVFKHERHYTSWLEANLPNNEAAREEFRNIKGGWTHKLSPALRSTLCREFHLSTHNTIVDYKEYTNRQLRHLDRTADGREREEAPWYLVGEENLYNLFTGPEIDRNIHEFRRFALAVFDEYKEKSLTAQGVATTDEKLLEGLVSALKCHAPMDGIHRGLPPRTRRTVYLTQQANNIKEAAVTILGLYIYTIDEPASLKANVDSVLKYRLSTQHREEIGTMFRQQFVAEDEFLKQFVQSSDFISQLRDWYEESNNQLGGGTMVRHTRKQSHRTPHATTKQNIRRSQEM